MGTQGLGFDETWFNETFPAATEGNPDYVAPPNYGGSAAQGGIAEIVKPNKRPFDPRQHIPDLSDDEAVLMHVVKLFLELV
jgi:hypothetical protein